MYYIIIIIIIIIDVIIVIMVKVEDGRDGGNPEFEGDVQDQYQDEVGDDHDDDDHDDDDDDEKLLTWQLYPDCGSSPPFVPNSISSLLASISLSSL